MKKERRVRAWGNQEIGTRLLEDQFIVVCVVSNCYLVCGPQLMILV